MKISIQIESRDDSANFNISAASLDAVQPNVLITHFIDHIMLQLREANAVKPVTYHVVCDHRGERLIEVIKTIRAHLGLGLKEARDMAESPHRIVMKTDDAKTARNFHEDLLTAGAVARVEVITGA